MPRAPTKAKPQAKRPTAKAKGKPWSKKKAERRVLALDSEWATEIRERVRNDCHPYQLAAVDDPSHFITLLVGRGGGKTTTMRARAIIKLTSVRRARMVFIAPTRGMAEELMWIPLKDSIEFYGLIDDFVFNETKMRCTCKRTGAVYQLVGLDDAGEVNKLRGRPFDEVHLDEASLYPARLLEDLLDRAVGPRLGERNGTIVMGGTPGHILSGQFYDYTRPGACELDEDGNSVPLHRPWSERAKPEFASWDSWSSHSWTLNSVAELPDAAARYPALVNLWAAALRMKRRKRWSDEHPVWLREYLGLWAADDTGMVFRYRPLRDGKPWNQWDPFGDHPLDGLQALAAAIAKLRDLGFRDLHFVYPGDNGHKDPFALNVLAFSPTDIERRIWHVMSFERTGMYAKPIADLLLGPEHNTTKPGGAFELTGWPDGAVMDSDHATIEELANVYGVRFKKADREANYKHGAIELTNGDLIDGRIKIIKGSPLERQLQQLQWAEDQFGRVKENKAQSNHCTDTLIYGRMEISELFESGIVDTTAPGSQPTAYVDQQRLDGEAGIGTDSEFEGLMTDVEYVDSWGNG